MVLLLSVIEAEVDHLINRYEVLLRPHGLTSHIIRYNHYNGGRASERPTASIPSTSVCLETPSGVWDSRLLVCLADMPAYNSVRMIRFFDSQRERI